MAVTADAATPECICTVEFRACPVHRIDGRLRRLKVYIEPRDWWIGYYRGDSHHYVCPLPCLVIRWNRKAHS